MSNSIRSMGRACWGLTTFHYLCLCKGFACVICQLDDTSSIHFRPCDAALAGPRHGLAVNAAFRQLIVCSHCNCWDARAARKLRVPAAFQEMHQADPFPTIYSAEVFTGCVQTLVVFK